MNQLYDLAPELNEEYSLFKADLTDGYYHLRLRAADRQRLSLFVGTQIYVLLFMNCGLSVAPWFLTKAMTPIVAFLRRLGHQVFAYIDNFFGAAKPRQLGAQPSGEDTQRLVRLMYLLFQRMDLTLQPRK